MGVFGKQFKDECLLSQPTNPFQKWELFFSFLSDWFVTDRLKEIKRPGDIS